MKKEKERLISKEGERKERKKEKKANMGLVIDLWVT